MFVKALEEFDCPAYKIPKGAIVDIESRFALAGIEAGKLVESSMDEKMGIIPKKETRTRRKAADKETNDG